MAVLKYLIRNKSNPKRIYVRLIDGKKIDLTASTGYLIDSENWSEGKRFVNQKKVFKGKESLVDNLIKLQSEILEQLNKDKGSERTINLEWLKHTIANYKNPELDKINDLLNNAIESYRDRLKTTINPKTKKPISKLTIKNFDTTIYRLRKFEEHKSKVYYLSEIDLSFHDEFSKFATEQLSLSINSIGNTLKQVKTVCLDALDRGYAISQQIVSKKFNAPTEKTKFITLNEFDLKRINKFKGSEHLINARNWLIIGCWTGCRVGDLMKLTTANLMKTTTGIDFIRYTQNKTSKQVDIPLHDDVKAILKRLGGFPRPISHVKLNEYIKKVCKESGIVELVEGDRQNPKTHLKESGTFEKWELVRSHTFRRSFASNHYDKLSNKVIMAVTGHSTERMLLAYIGETEKDHLEDFIESWKETASNEPKTIDLNKQMSV